MRLSIANFRGIKNADIQTGKVTGLFGKNYAGKTSLLQALQVAVTGIDLPIDELTKKTASKLVHGAQKKAFVKLESDTGDTTVSYPDINRASSGDPIEINTHAAGIDSLLYMKPADRVQYLSELLDTKPTIEQLEKKLSKIDLLAPDKREQIVNTAKVNGWDDAHQLASQMRTQLTGAWKEVTGDNWGAKKADGWRPDTWDIALENAKAEDLQAQLTQEQEWLEAALTSEAVEAHDVDRLKHLVSVKRKRQEDVDNKIIMLNALREGLTTARKTLQDAQAAIKEDNSIDCPHCGGKVVMRGGQLHEYTPLTEEEKAACQEAIDDAQDRVDGITADMAKSNDAVINAKSKLQESKGAETKLKELQGKPRGKTDTHAVEDCRSRVKQAEDALAAKKQVEKADLIYQKYVACKDVIDLLAPDGMRRLAAVKATKIFNDTLKTIISSSKYWGPVFLNDEFRFSFGGRPFGLCSESEQWRCRVAVQYAIARISKAPLVIIDRSDVLDADGRNGLFRIAGSYDGETVIAMTAKKEEVPPLDKIGGVSYWVENGEVEKL